MARKPKSETPVKTPEERQKEKRDRFARLAEKRTANALRAISNVARLANKSSYDYKREEAEQIVAAIIDASAAMQAEFADSDGGKSRFQLKLAS